MRQRQRSGEVVEIPSAVVCLADRLPWWPIQSLKARLDGRDPCQPGDPVPCEHQLRLWPGEPIGDPHWYVIAEWESVTSHDFGKLNQTIADLGYRARYQAPYWKSAMVNEYLEIGEYVYWAIGTNQLCRTRIEWQQQEPIRQPRS